MRYGISLTWTSSPALRRAADTANPSLRYRVHCLTDWPAHDVIAYPLLVQQMLRLDSAGVQAMATRSAVFAADLNETVAPTELGFSCQPSATAVNAAHVDVTGFTTRLAAQMSTRATDVTETDTRQRDPSADPLAAVMPVTRV